MADKNAEVAVEGNGGMKKTLSLWNFFTIGFGAIIGTGWVLQVGDWMVVGGGACRRGFGQSTRPARGRQQLPVPRSGRGNCRFD